MALKIPSPPPESIRAFEAVLAPTRKGKVGGIEARFDKRILGAPEAIPIYTLGLDSVARGDLGAAKAVGWHYLVADKAGNAAADVYSDPDQQRHSFGALNRGAIVDQTISGLAGVKTTEHDDRDYELRLLRVPALYIVALWLKADDSTYDQFISVGPKESPFSPGTILSWSDLHQRLRDDAEKRLRFDAPTKGQPGRRR